MIIEMDQTEKVRENRLRRMAQRQGYQVVRSRRRDPRAVDFGLYMIVKPTTNEVVAGGVAGFGLDDVERWLITDPESSN